MAHFAKLDNQNFVLSVHCVVNEVLDPANEEISGINFLSDLHNHIKWKQTSYNGRIRKNFAGIGYFYDEQRDAFIAPKPDHAIGFDERTCRWIVPDEGLNA
jgi:hypothetical protein